MYKYLSKSFEVSKDAPKEIDNWLNSFEEKREGRSMWAYNYEIKGYVCSSHENLIIITLYIWEYADQ